MPNINALSLVRFMRRFKIYPKCPPTLDHFWANMNLTNLNLVEINPMALEKKSIKVD